MHQVGFYYIDARFCYLRNSGSSTDCTACSLLIGVLFSLSDRFISHIPFNIARSLDAMNIRTIIIGFLFYDVSSAEWIRWYRYIRPNGNDKFNVFRAMLFFTWRSFQEGFIGKTRTMVQVNCVFWAVNGDRAAAATLRVCRHCHLNV